MATRGNKFMLGVFKLGYKAKHNPQTDKPIDKYFELASVKGQTKRAKPKKEKKLSIEEENKQLMEELRKGVA